MTTSILVYCTPKLKCLRSNLILGHNTQANISNYVLTYDLKAVKFYLGIRVSKRTE